MVPDSPELLLLLEAKTQQERSREVFSGLRVQLERLESMGTPDPTHRSFHVAPEMENDRSVLFETCRLRPVGQTFSFSHVIVNDMRRTPNGGRRLEISEFAVFGGHNAIVGNKSVQTLPSHGTPWTPIDTSGPILFSLDDNRVRIVRGRNNHLTLPQLKKHLSASATIEQRVLAHDLPEVLSSLSSATARSTSGWRTKEPEPAHVRAQAADLRR